MVFEKINILKSENTLFFGQNNKKKWANLVFFI